MKNEITAKRLIEALNDNNMKAQELADIAKINKSSISQYVNGSHAPSNFSAGKMAAVLGVNPVWLMGYDAPKYVDQIDGYYTNPDTAQKAQDLFDDPSMRMLFDAARDAKPEDLQKAADFLKAAKALTLNLDNEGC